MTKKYAKKYNREYYQLHKEEIKEARKNYYELNKDKIKEYQAENKEKIREYKHEYDIKYNKLHKEENAARCKEYQAIHREEIRQYKNEYQDNRRKTDPLFKLACNLRKRIRAAIKQNNKTGSAVKDLGCTIEFLKKYIESKFYGDMTWDNWGTVWELDHIVPLFKFDLMDKKQFKRAVNYKNLQPLTKKDHRKKTNREVSEWSNH